MLHFITFLLILFCPFQQHLHAGAAISRPLSSNDSTSIHLYDDLLTLIGQHLTLITLSRLPSIFFNPSSLKYSLESLLQSIPYTPTSAPLFKNLYFSKREPMIIASIHAANTLAQKLGLTGTTRDTSIELSSAPQQGDTSAPAAWVGGLAVLTQQLMVQVNHNEVPTLLLPWLYIPDSQVFNFMVEYDFQSQKTETQGTMFFAPQGDSNRYTVNQVIERMLPLSERLRFEWSYFSFSIIYVLHLREGIPRVVGNEIKVIETLQEYQKRYMGLYSVGCTLWTSSWLRKKGYVRLGKKALRELLEAPKTDAFSRQWEGWKEELEDELKKSEK